MSNNITSYKKLRNSQVPMMPGFHSWLLSMGFKKKSADNYCSWIKHLKIEDDSLSGLKFLKVVAQLVQKGNYFWAKQIVDYVSEDIANLGKTKDVINDRCALSYFADYIQSEPATSGDCSSLAIGVTPLTVYFKTVRKDVPYDAMYFLIRKLGKENFIRLAIESCLFFHPDDVTDRFNHIVKCKSSVLPARRGTLLSTGVDGYQVLGNSIEYVDPATTNRYTITIDKDGNREVRKVIKKYTGFTVSIGRDSMLQNYMISHIWGRTLDPRYFTNLWNIVLVPSWANTLLDKNNPADELACQFKATIMALCIKVYQMKRLSWGNIGMGCPAVVGPSNIQHGLYDITMVTKNPGPQFYPPFMRKIISI